MDIQASAYNVVRSVFDQQTRNRLKKIKSKLQNSLGPLKKIIYGSFTAEDLYEEFRQKMPDDFQILMVHSSAYNIMPMYSGTMPELLQILLNLVGPNRTLAMPAFFFGEENYHYDVIRYYTEHPVFHITRTRSQMGLLTEVFRRHPKVKRSLHPTHRIAALGPLAEELIKDHHLCRTSCGKGSPFGKMTRFKTTILGIGVRYFHCMTQTHASEDLLLEGGKYPIKFAEKNLPITLINERNEKVAYTLTVHVTDAYQRRVHPLLRNLLTDDEMYEWGFHGAPMFYADAGRVTEALINAALKGRSAYY